MADRNTNTMESRIARDIDIIEESIMDLHPSILKLLLKDKTTKKNILWCTKDYESNGGQVIDKANLRTLLNLAKAVGCNIKDILEDVELVELYEEVENE